MRQYLDLMRQILEEGEEKTDRTGTGTLSLFGPQMEFDLAEGFPLLTTKKLYVRAILYELFWILNGDTNVRYLQEHNVSIWDEWADQHGDLGPVYGRQWRSWRNLVEQIGHKDDPNWYMDEPIDQISDVLLTLRDNPDSRRHLVVAWNPADISKMKLPPCHVLFQFYVSNGRDGQKKLSCKLYQRSADFFLGVPFNIASYAFLTHMFAQQLGYGVGRFIWTGGDVHLYQNHLEQARLQLTREPRPLPTLQINRHPKSLFDYRFEDFTLTGYDAHPHIAAPVAV